MYTWCVYNLQHAYHMRSDIFLIKATLYQYCIYSTYYLLNIPLFMHRVIWTYN